MNTTYKTLESLIETLQKTGKIRFSKSDFRYYNESVPDSLLQEVSIHIAPSVIEYFRQVDFIHIAWFLAEENNIEYIDESLDMIEGTIHIPDFTSFINHLKDNNLKNIIDPYKSLKKEDFEALNDYIPFDFLNGDGAVCLKIIDKQVIDQLYLVHLGSDSFIKPLNTSVENYLKVGIQNYFFSEWQQACFLNDNIKKEQIKFYLKQILAPGY